MYFFIYTEQLRYYYTTPQGENKTKQYAMKEKIWKQRTLGKENLDC